MAFGIEQAYGFDANDKKITSHDYLQISFLNKLPVGTIVFREYGVWCTKRNEVAIECKPVGVVAAGKFGDNVLEKY